MKYHVNLPAIAICGPTGSGKSGLALAITRAFDGEVIGCDSLQVYRHFDIGTAKLPERARQGIPHHLIDVAEGGKGFTAGDFAQLGREALRSIAERGRLPVVAGGTGFYLRALIDGLSPSPPSCGMLRARLGRKELARSGSLHRMLKRLDPTTAARIHENDVPKLIRALEIRFLSSRNASEQPARDRLSGFRFLKIGLFPPRNELYAALDRRCAEMLSGGLLDEIRTILSLGIPRDAKPFESLGYKEGLALLEGRLTSSEALEQMQRDTRRYAKRQLTWFRHEPDIVSLSGFGDDPAIQDEARTLVERLLNLS